MYGISGVQTQEVAAGMCQAGWNLVPFYAGNLPASFVGGVNMIVVEFDGLLVPAGEVQVVEDLSLDKRNPTADLDGDEISVSYKSKGGTIRAEGRTLVITGATPKDALTLKVKANKGTGDGVARVCGIISDGGFKKISLAGSLDYIRLGNELGKLILKGGNLGTPCATRRFQAVLAPGSAKPANSILVKAGKHAASKQPIGGSIHANILCGTLAAEPATSTSRGPIKMIAAKGGNLGTDGRPGWLMAASLDTLLLKGGKAGGGDLRDYALYFTGETQPGKATSVKKLLLNAVYDATGSNTIVVCGHSADIDPRTVNSWVGQPVAFSFGKMIVKGLELEGTVVIKEWLKGSKGKHVKSKAADAAVWIVNGAIE